MNDVYEALQAKEKMKQMVSFEGLTSNGEALSVRGRTQKKSNNSYRGKSSNCYHGRSKSRDKDDKFCKYCKKKTTHFISKCIKLKNKEKRAGTYRPKGKPNEEGNASVATDGSSDGNEVLVAFARCANSGDEWILDSSASFIYALIEIGSSHMILSMVVLLKWVMTVHIELLALVLFRSKRIMVLSEL